MSSPTPLDTSNFTYDKSDHNPAHAKEMLDKVTGMYQTIIEKSCTGCGCKQQRKIDALHHQMLQAAKTQKNAKANLAQAEESYYIESKGAPWYSKFREEQASSKASEQTNGMLSDFTTRKTTVQRNIDYYASQLAYKKNLDALVTGYNTQLSQIQGDIGSAKSDTAVAHRLTTYYQHQEPLVRKVTYYLKIVYWIVVGITTLGFIWKSYKAYRLGSLGSMSTAFVSVVLLYLIPLYGLNLLIASIRPTVIT
jgi:hypothetical protein